MGLGLYVSRPESRAKKTEDIAALHLDLYGSKDSKGVDPGSTVSDGENNGLYSSKP